MSKGWDNATLKKLKALTGKGLSTSEIGKRLGMSKNAIVGKLNRLGWNAKATSAVSDTTKATATKKSATTKAGAATKAGTTKATTKKTAVKTAEKKATTKDTAKTTQKKAAPVKKTTETKTVAKATTKKTEPAVKETKASAKTLAMHQRIIQHSLEMANLKPNQCRWPIGDPDSERFHFCGETVFVGKPYCYEHCKQAYQFTPPKKK